MTLSVPTVGLPNTAFEPTATALNNSGLQHIDVHIISNVPAAAGSGEVLISHVMPSMELITLR